MSVHHKKKHRSHKCSKHNTKQPLIILGPAGPAGPAGPSFLVNDTVFVDPTFGNDTTAKVESPAFPYKTITAAITAAAARATATASWQVQIRPGTYTENIVLQNYVNLLGVSTTGFFGSGLSFASPVGLNEVQIIGTLSDGGITVASNFFPTIANLSFNTTQVPAASLSSGTLVTANLLFLQYQLHRPYHTISLRTIVDQ